MTGRYYKPVETYRTEGAETLFLDHGQHRRDRGHGRGRAARAGQAGRADQAPAVAAFPFDEFREAAKGAKQIIVIDRAVSYGGPGGPVASEIRSVLYGEDNMPGVTNFLCGLAGPRRQPAGLHGHVRTEPRKCSRARSGRKTTFFTGSENRWKPEPVCRDYASRLQNGVHHGSIKCLRRSSVGKEGIFFPGPPRLPGLRRGPGRETGGQGPGQQRHRGQRHRLHGDHLLAPALYQLEGALAARGL